MKDNRPKIFLADICIPIQILIGSIVEKVRVCEPSKFAGEIYCMLLNFDYMYQMLI